MILSSMEVLQHFSQGLKMRETFREDLLHIHVQVLCKYMRLLTKRMGRKHSDLPSEQFAVSWQIQF